MKGRVAIVTGAVGGIGSAVATVLAEAGASPCLCDTAPLDGGAAALRAHGGPVLPLRLDVTQREAVVAMVAQVEAAFGRVDIVVNVAGIVSAGAAATLAEGE